MEVRKYPELVVALVSAVGTNLDPLVAELSQAFAQVNYEVSGDSEIRISSLIETTFSQRRPLGLDKGKSRIQALMDAGDDLRRVTNNGSGAAILAIEEILARRRIREREDPSPRRTVSIIRSLKHPDEIHLLRRVYGRRVFVLGVWSSPEDRRKCTYEKLVRTHPEHHENTSWYAAETQRLTERDEDDVQERLGQHIRDAFGLADAFVIARTGTPTRAEVYRFVELLFGNPFLTPSRDELAIYEAHAAMLRSSAGSRQVGAAIIDDDGELIVTGTNEVPKVGGGQYWDGEVPDHRDFLVGFDANDRLKLDVINDLLTRLYQGRWLAEARLKKRYELGRSPSEQINQLSELAIEPHGPLSRSRVNRLIEFGRIAHAEMAAICTAARRGVSVRNSSLFVTTYPCHECARLIIAAGIKRVVYVDPYPKSQVPIMYPDHITTEDNSGELNRIPFVPFKGITSRLFADVFSANRKRIGVSGEYDRWHPRDASPRLVQETVDEAATSLAEHQEVNSLAELLIEKKWLRPRRTYLAKENSGRKSQFITGIYETMNEYAGMVAP